MHNPRIVVAVATWFDCPRRTYVCYGHNKDYQTCAARKGLDDVAVYRRRVAAGTTAYIVSFIAALIYLVCGGKNRTELHTGRWGYRVFFGCHGHLHGVAEAVGRPDARRSATAAAGARLPSRRHTLSRYSERFGVGAFRNDETNHEHRIKF